MFNKYLLAFCSHDGNNILAFFCNIYRLLKELPHLLIKRRLLSMVSTYGLVVSGIGSKTFEPYPAKYIFVRVVIT